MKNRTSGFTLVELMVVVLLVGLVALVATQIPLFTLSSWTKGSERLKMQRDAHLFMIKIQRELRPSSFSQINTLDPNYQLIIQPDNRFFWWDEVNDKLYYQKAGKDELVIDGKVTQFEATEVTSADGTRTINITLTLLRGGGETTLTTAVKSRN